MILKSTNGKVILYKDDLPQFTDNQILLATQKAYAPAMELLVELIEDKIHNTSGSVQDNFIAYCKLHGIEVVLGEDDLHDF